MRKPPLQDVIVKNKEPMQRTIRPDRFVQNERIQQPTSHDGYEYGAPYENEQEFSQRHGKVRRNFSGRTNKRWVITAFGIGIIVILSSISLSLLFAGATVTVYPKQDTVVVNALFTVDASGGAQGVMPVERMAIEKTVSRAVVALGEEEVEERASGTITIYNEYSETPQRIIPRTRFKSSSGLIYRVGEAVEIPGMKTDGSPGTIEVTVRAEEPGEGHNIGPDTFSIPGYEDLPQEGKIYAKSSESMTGGFKGIRRTVHEQDRSTALQELETELRDQLLDAAFNSSDSPEQYHLFKETVFYEFEPLPDEPAETDKVTIALKGTLHGLLFPKDALAKRLAQLTLSTYSDVPIRIDNIEELSVSIVPEGEEGTEKVWEAPVYKVNAQGKAHFIWEYDESMLASDFVGKDKEVLHTSSEGGILGSYPGIDRLEVSIRPFWKRNFPESADDIVIITELDD